MPNRIIRESILTSDRVETLDPPAEVFFRRLLSKVDDHGRYDARPSILRASLFPLRIDRVREADCTRWMAACQKAGLIALYQHDGKPYLAVANTGWQARSPSRFPDPLQASANICAQAQANAPLVVDVGVVVDEVEQGAPPAASPPPKDAAQGKRLPADWQPGPAGIAWAKGKRPDLDLTEEVEKFRDYWHAQPGAKGRKADWGLTWKTWVRGARTAQGFAAPPVVPRNPQGSSPRLSREEEKAREAEALAEMRRQFPEEFGIAH